MAASMVSVKDAERKSVLSAATNGIARANAPRMLVPESSSSSRKTRVGRHATTVEQLLNSKKDAII